MITWDRLPGPDRLLTELLAELDQGRSICLLAPANAPGGLPDVLISRIHAAAGYHFVVRSEPDLLDQPDPVAALCERLDGRLTANLAPEDLVMEDWFGGNIIVCDGGHEAVQWDRWLDFLSRYIPACRGRSTCDIARFVIVLRGRTALRPPPLDICLYVRRWEGVVSRLDLAVYADRLLAQRGWPPVQRRVGASLIAELSLPDSGVAEALSELPLEQLLDPASMLDFFRSRYPQRPAAGRAMEDWAAGYLDHPASRTGVRHPAVDAWQDEPGRLRQRVWRGLVREVMPLIEEVKLLLLEEAPLANRADLLVLEPNRLADHLARHVRNYRDRERLCRDLHLLWEVRCEVAHLRLAHGQLAELIALVQRLEMHPWLADG